MSRRRRLALSLGAPVAAFAAGASLGLAGIGGSGVTRPCPYTFGIAVMRAEIVCWRDGLVRDIRYDRGTITAMAPGRILTVSERDGTVVTVQVANGARITVGGYPAGYSALRKNMRVQIQREGDGPADTVYATRR
jgi:hypothetical protein